MEHRSLLDEPCVRPVRGMSWDLWGEWTTLMITMLMVMGTCPLQGRTPKSG